MSQATSPFSLQQKTIVVTGASSGIGRQCAISCSQAGARVILMGRSEERLEETLSLMDRRSDHHCFSIDINDFAGLASVIDEAVRAVGSVSGLVNAAGISVTYPLRVMNPEKMQDTFSTNVYASIQLAKLVCRTNTRHEQGVSVVFITSVMGMVGESGKSLYGMSKGALLAGVKSLAIEYATKNIRFNCLSPGVVETPMSMNSVYSKNEAALDKIKSYHPMGLGQVTDVANGVVYLLSDAARWVTGTNLVIDGGYSAR